MLKIATLACVLLAAAKPAAAQLYSDDALRAEQARARENIEYTVSHQLLDTAPPAIRQKLRAVQVDMPPRSKENPAFPLDFHSDANTVTVPALSLKFFSDLTILWAWFDKHHCNQTALVSYLIIILDRRPEARALAGPLETFGIAEGEALRDPEVDKVSLRNLNTGMNFILAHELGHIYNGDAFARSPDDSIAREERADRFAMDLLAQAHIPPFGMVQFFSAARLKDPAADTAASGSHPLSHARLSALSSRIRRAPDDFLKPGLTGQDLQTERARILRMADQVTEIANAMKGEGFVFDKDSPVKEAPPSTYRQACSNR